MGLFSSKTTNNTGDAVRHPGTPTGGLTIGAAVLGGGGGGSLSSTDYAQYGQSTMDALRRAQDLAVMQAITPPHIFTTANRYDIDSDSTRKLMICMRLRTDEMPFQHLSTAHSGDKVFVFIVQNGQPVTLEDDASLFPSDKLVSQLTLLK